FTRGDRLPLKRQTPRRGMAGAESSLVWTSAVFCLYDDVALADAKRVASSIVGSQSRSPGRRACLGYFGNGAPFALFSLLAPILSHAPRSPSPRQADSKDHGCPSRRPCYEVEATRLRYQ